jgi:hypothetical protein
VDCLDGVAILVGDIRDSCIGKFFGDEIDARLRQTALAIHFPCSSFANDDYSLEDERHTRKGQKV